MIRRAVSFRHYTREKIEQDSFSGEFHGKMQMGEEGMFPLSFVYEMLISIRGFGDETIDPETNFIKLRGSYDQ